MVRDMESMSINEVCQALDSIAEIHLFTTLTTNEQAGYEKPCEFESGCSRRAPLSPQPPRIGR